jgi:hypothetical protein
MCNTCGNSTCFGNCYPSVPNQWNTCSAPPVPCPTIVPCPCPAPVGLNLMFARVATTNLEFFNMPMTPKTLIAAPGAGKLIVPLQVQNFLDFGTTPYQDSGVLTPNLIMSIGAQGIISDSAILGAIIDQTTQYQLPIYTTPGTLDNQPLTLSTISQPIVGDSVLYSYIIYTIVNL